MGFNAGARSVGRAIRDLFYVAFNGKKVGIDYEPGETGLNTKALAETGKELLLLYAAYSEVAKKFIEVVALPKPYSAATWGRLISALLGSALCCHIIFSRKGAGRKTYSYGRVPRLVARVVIWLILPALAYAATDLIKGSSPYVSGESASLTVSAGSWHLVRKEGAGAGETRVYSLEVGFPQNTTNRSEDISVLVRPHSGFKLVSVNHDDKPGEVIPREEEPLLWGAVTDERVHYLFPKFKPERRWKLLVTVGVQNQDRTFGESLPVMATVYFY